MKKIILYTAMFLLTLVTQAQIKTPAPSPMQTLEQTVGLTDVTLKYSRPSVKGRTIFGGLVPFDAMWRTGANQNSMITFSDDILIGEATVKAGTYAIFTKPGAVNWEVYFYNDTQNWGTPKKWDDSKVIAKVVAKTYQMPTSVETFTMAINDIKIDGATLAIIWDKTYVSVGFNVMTDKMVSASIDKVMGAPSAADYYSAAVYYLEADKDVNKAKTWIDAAVALNATAFWYKRQQSLIYAKSGDIKGAIKAAKASMAQAQEAGNMDYVALNKKSLKQWGAK
ncbi:DUF2911 domain-containing protein [Flavobacteriaceae bacterium]|nr:DUF2911 domain-containing protein [Flavobacteriaceae bacterium]